MVLSGLGTVACRPDDPNSSGPRLEASASPQAIEEAKAAADLIALRYLGKLGGVTDKRTPPPNSAHIPGAPRPRTSVELYASLTNNPSAQDALTRYAQDRAVQWQDPAIKAYLHVNPNPGDPYGTLLQDSRLNKLNADTPTTLTSTLYPATDYPDGTRADTCVAVSVEVRLGGYHAQALGLTVIGSMVFSGGIWQQSDQPPIMATRVDHTLT